MAKKVQEDISNMYKEHGLILDSIYEKMKYKVNSHDVEGYKFYSAPMDLRVGKIPKKFHKSNPYTIDNIKNYLHLNNIETELVSDTYIDQSSKLEWECKCGERILVSWNKFQQGQQICEKCRLDIVYLKNYYRNYDDIRKVFIDRNCTLITNKDVIKSRDKIEYICNKHADMGMQTTTITDFITVGSGCKYCGREKVAMAKRTNESEIKLIIENLGLIYVRNIYENGSCIILYFCPKHYDVGIQRKPLGSLRRGSGCPYCAGVKSYIPENYHEYFIKEMENINPNILILSNDIKYNTTVDCGCAIDGHTWSNTTYKLLNGVGCVICGFEYKVPSHEKRKEYFLSEVSKKLPNIDIVGEYCGNKEKIKCYCKICGTIFYNTPTMLLKQLLVACPTCAYSGVKSSGEIKLESIISKMGINYITQKRFENCKHKTFLYFDMFLPDENILIEYDGQQHFIPIEHFGGKENLEKTQIRDGIKDKYCIENKIHLIRIPYYEYNNMEEFLKIELQKLNINVE